MPHVPADLLLEIAALFMREASRDGYAKLRLEALLLSFDQVVSPSVNLADRWT